MTKRKYILNTVRKRNFIGVEKLIYLHIIFLIIYRDVILTYGLPYTRKSEKNDIKIYRMFLYKMDF